MSTLGSGEDLNNCVDAGTIYTCNSGSIATTLVNRPNDNFAFGLYVRHAPLSPNTIYQILFSNSGRVWQRKRDNNNWASWQEFSFNIPSFYKNYADFAALANALGIGFQERTIPANSYLDFNIKEVAIFTVCISSDVFAICLNNLGTITILADKFHLFGTTSGFTYVISGGASGKTFSIQNNSGSSVKTQITQLGYTRSWV